jgi:hypothetical protein
LSHHLLNTTLTVAKEEKKAKEIEEFLTEEILKVAGKVWRLVNDVTIELSNVTRLVNDMKTKWQHRTEASTLYR